MKLHNLTLSILLTTICHFSLFPHAKAQQIICFDGEFSKTDRFDNDCNPDNSSSYQEDANRNCETFCQNQYPVCKHKMNKIECDSNSISWLKSDPSQAHTSTDIVNSRDIAQGYEKDQYSQVYQGTCECFLEKSTPKDTFYLNPYGGHQSTIFNENDSTHFYYNHSFSY